MGNKNKCDRCYSDAKKDKHYCSDECRIAELRMLWKKIHNVFEDMT